MGSNLLINYGFVPVCALFFEYDAIIAKPFLHDDGVY
jgi:hypothetical protein